MDSEAVVYGVDHPARALAVAEGDGETVRFLLGTQTVNDTNEVHVIEFDDDTSRISSVVLSYPHGEVWSIGSSSKDATVFASCYQAVYGNQVQRKALLHRIPESLDGTIHHTPVQELGDLTGDEGDGGAVKVAWSPGSGNHAACVYERALRKWDLETMTHDLVHKANTTGKTPLVTMVWNPHDEGSSQMVVVEGCNLIGLDTRTKRGTHTFEVNHAHGEYVRDVDFNPNKPYSVASAGDDGAIKFWDVREASKPLKTITRHSHWVWGVRYNRFHDQLVLSCSSDSQVLLSNVVSVSSEPYGNFIDDDSDDDEARGDASDGEREMDNMGGDGKNKRSEDHLVCTYDTHEDSVYAAEWSNVDPWVFASLSYDGRFVIQRVPLEEKYLLLL